MLTEKENFMLTLSGQCPEWVPNYSILASSDPKAPVPAIVLMTPPFINEHRKVGVGGIDVWGVKYVPGDAVGGATMPETKNFILKDIRKWRDVIKAPSLEGYDWEKMAKDHLEASGVDRSQTAVAFDVHFGYFQHLMAFMGFTEGLCAFYEEPEEVFALLDYISDFYCKITEKMIDYYKPEVLSLKDDTASLKAPFISPEVYEEILIPIYKKHAKFAWDRGIPISFHNCGKCETLLDSLVNIGVRLWDPAQTCNDLPAIKKKYGNNLVIAGGWDAKGRLLDDDVTEEELYQAVQDTFDMLAPGGGYCFGGGFIVAHGDENAIRKNKIIHKAAYEIGHSFYKK